jgi:hypothetical protein
MEVILFDANGLTFSWDFDSSDGIQNQSSVAEPYHTYNTLSNFTVTLTVWDPAKNSDSDTLKATIKARPISVIDSITPDPSTRGETVTFVGHGTDEDGTVVNYRWHSSIDGVISTDENFSINTLKMDSTLSLFLSKIMKIFGLKIQQPRLLSIIHQIGKNLEKIQRIMVLLHQLSLELVI